jgi:hypothetical protein
MSVQAIRALVLAANVLVIAVIASVAYLTFGPVDWDLWSVEAPQLSRFEPPALGEDPKRREQEVYQAISRVFEHEEPEQAAPPPTQREAAPPPPPKVSGIVVRVLQYDVNRPDASSALLFDPRSRAERFFQVGLDLGEPGLGFERYKGTRVQEITQTEVVLLEPGGNEVRLPGPKPGSAQ